MASYIALIPDVNQNQNGGVALLTPEERMWLAARHDLVRAPDYWRPVRWAELGARMHDDAPSTVRPL
jgi:hypothetical protein